MAHIHKLPLTLNRSKEKLQKTFDREKRRNLRKSRMRGIPLPGQTEVQWMPRAKKRYTVRQSCRYLVRDQLPPWSGAAVIHDLLSHDPLILLGSIIKAHDRCHHDVGLYMRSVEAGIRKRWWIFCWRLEEMLYTSLNDGWLRNRGEGIFNIWQLLNDWLKETVADLTGCLGTPTISGSLCRLRLPDWTYAKLHYYSLQCPFFSSYLFTLGDAGVYLLFAP